MGKANVSGLNHILVRLVGRWLFVPILGVWVTGLACFGYFLFQSLLDQQQETLRFMARTVERHLEQGGRMIDALAIVAETEPAADLSSAMEGAWKGYKSFDTIYRIDRYDRIVNIMPNDSGYLDLDMSNWLKSRDDVAIAKGITISRPFISLRTGEPTVYVLRQLNMGGYIVGELNVGILQSDVELVAGKAKKDMIMILDQSGKLLAHPMRELVRQQGNYSVMEIFRQGLSGGASLIYEYEGKKNLGCALLIQPAGWVIIDQAPLFVLLEPYFLVLGMATVVSLGIWVMLAWNLRRKIQASVVEPLVRFRQRTAAVAVGDYDTGSQLSVIESGFGELEELSYDFQWMCDVLKARQEALEESKARYYSLFEQVPVGILRFTPDGRMLECNHAYCEIMGLASSEEALRENVFHSIVVDDGAENFERVLGKEIQNDMEAHVRRLDGTAIWVVIRWQVVRDEQGEILYYDCSMADVTGRKNAEMELQSSYDNLERIVAMRTQELRDINEKLVLMNGELSSMNEEVTNSNGELQKEIGRREMAERELSQSLQELKEMQASLIRQEKMAALGELIASIAHEINTPLGVGITASSHFCNVAKQFYEASQKRTLTRMELKEFVEDSLESAELILRNLERAGKLMKSFKQVLLDQAVEKLRTFNVKQYVSEVVQSLNPQIEKAKHNVWVQGDDDLVIEGYPGALAQIVTNLMINSFRHGYDGNTRGNIMLSVEAAAGQILICYSDDGRGMEKEVLERAFEPFFSTQRNIGATGLGLHVVHTIVTKQFGGKIECDSKPGQGTVFRIWLPQN